MSSIFTQVLQALGETLAGGNMLPLHLLQPALMGPPCHPAWISPCLRPRQALGRHHLQLLNREAQAAPQLDHHHQHHNPTTLSASLLLPHISAIWWLVWSGQGLLCSGALLHFSTPGTQESATSSSLPSSLFNVQWPKFNSPTPHPILQEHRPDPRARTAQTTADHSLNKTLDGVGVSAVNMYLVVFRDISVESLFYTPPLAHWVSSYSCPLLVPF
ncbi:hypothetical protein PTTG_07023 [Puccinia triticina 1-1 BBBD Race 1]|uniref:Uncharacterized protein n=1 Tax=Puccinia triticina (isolate 1-1 / race 1 (BBBD)) TaxID=630390 RepID=A0A180GRH2_PUCT1|nr:hypothetical protein PTTG_07023 [Puccinia triticina 1-1 BBBD Race 1]